MDDWSAKESGVQQYARASPSRCSLPGSNVSKFACCIHASATEALQLKRIADQCFSNHANFLVMSIAIQRAAAKGDILVLFARDKKWRLSARCYIVIRRNSSPILGSLRCRLSGSVLHLLSSPRPIILSCTTRSRLSTHYPLRSAHMGVGAYFTHGCAARPAAAAFSGHIKIWFAPCTIYTVMGSCAKCEQIGRIESLTLEM
jgi:hypothetical protein